MAKPAKVRYGSVSRDTAGYSVGGKERGYEVGFSVKDPRRQAVS